jgi:hypothetical protein
VPALLIFEMQVFAIMQFQEMLGRQIKDMAG